MAVFVERGELLVCGPCRNKCCVPLHEIFVQFLLHTRSTDVRWAPGQKSRW